ncbi:hypothetical protein ACIQWA_13470 [Kitasatospora sp. NPDC098652]|uniref:hypothetical protein n=1 Tax=Kitasatospora sp. NPDC098652 TaxID=3364095 RepID=UPI003822BCF7
MKWQQGRSAVDGMLSRKELERVPASREQVAGDAPKVTAIIELAERVLDEMSPF